MLAARIAFSNPDSEAARARYIEDHKSYLRSADIAILQSGPVFGEDGKQIGALVVADVETLTQLKDFSDGDPFVRHGIYRDVKIVEWRVSIDNPRSR
jgi:uncharacterized protein